MYEQAAVRMGMEAFLIPLKLDILSRMIVRRYEAVSEP